MAARRRRRDCRRCADPGLLHQPGVLRHVPPPSPASQPGAGAARLLRLPHLPAPRRRRLVPHFVGPHLQLQRLNHHEPVQCVSGEENERLDGDDRFHTLWTPASPPATPSLRASMMRARAGGWAACASAHGAAVSAAWLRQEASMGGHVCLLGSWIAGRVFALFGHRSRVAPGLQALFRPCSVIAAAWLLHGSCSSPACWPPCCRSKAARGAGGGGVCGHGLPTWLFGCSANGVAASLSGIWKSFVSRRLPVVA
mmetsp:Transcript_35321/g.104482  ORF Transcript_35321/g.104482 Transcript_35321/m.104482 type:complete len:254 (+) Transcript_35321:1543-2304(+)